MLIINNEYIKHIKAIPLLFVTDVFNFSFDAFEKPYKLYRPLYMLTFALDYYIWKLNSFGYHLTNVIIHSLDSFLVFTLILSLFTNYPLALLTSILFCVHPMQTESVSFISGRAELLVSLFTLLTLVFYIDYTKSKQGLKYFFSLLSLICALFSREAGFLIFVPFFVAFAGIKSNIPKKSVFVHFVSFAGILLIYIISRLILILPLQLGPKSIYPLGWDIFNFIYLLLEYVKLLIYPHSLHIFRSIAPISSFQLVYLISPILFVISLAIILILALKQRKYVIPFGIIWFIFTLIYIAEIMYYKSSNQIAVEEHWVYLASVGFFVILAYLILNVKKIKLLTATCAMVIIGYSALTVINNGHWRDEILFYRYNLKLIEPRLSIVPRLNFSTALYNRGLYKEAMDEVKLILSIEPQELFAYIQLGDILRAMKKIPEAKEVYRNALKIDYFCWQANRRLAMLAKETGEVYKDESNPLLSDTENKIIAFIRMGNFNDALEALQKAISISPTASLYTLAGITFGKMGLYDKAINAFNAALDIDPNYTVALYNLAETYEIKNLSRQAAQIRSKIRLTK